MSDEDENLCEFLANVGGDYAVTLSEANLTDDISENGPRELRPIERKLARRMAAEHEERRKRQRL